MEIGAYRRAERGRLLCSVKSQDKAGGNVVLCLAERHLVTFLRDRCVPFPIMSPFLIRGNGNMGHNPGRDGLKGLFNQKVCPSRTGKYETLTSMQLLD